MTRTIPKEIKEIVDFVRVKENQGFKLIHVFQRTDGTLIFWFDDRGAYAFDYLDTETSEEKRELFKLLNFFSGGNEK